MYWRPRAKRASPVMQAEGGVIPAFWFFGMYLNRVFALAPWFEKTLRFRDKKHSADWSVGGAPFSLLR
jgi:hypothetical protein